MKVVNNQPGRAGLRALEPIPQRNDPTVSGANGSQKERQTNFSKLFNQAVERQYQLHLSRHVQERFQQRQVDFNVEQFQQIRDAVQLAQEKGIKDSLILTKESAFIVNIPNKTVVTVMERDAARFRVFTNIDGAVITS